MKHLHLLPAKIQQAALGLVLTAAPAIVVGFAFHNLTGAVGTFLTSTVFMLLLGDYRPPSSLATRRRSARVAALG